MVQDEFLATLREKTTPVSIFLVSGIQLVGCVDSYDSQTITIVSDTGTQLVFKRQIATIQENKNAGKLKEKRRANRLFR